MREHQTNSAAIEESKAGDFEEEGNLKSVAVERDRTSEVRDLDRNLA